MPNHTEIHQLLDDASRIIAEVKRRLTEPDDSSDEFEDVPKIEEWEQVNSDKWRCEVDRFELIIDRLDGDSYWWHIRDRRAKKRVAAGCKGRPTARNARHSARRWYLREAHS